MKPTTVKITFYLNVEASDTIDAAEKAKAIVRSGKFPAPIVEVDPEDEEYPTI